MILFSKIYDKAINLFDDPKITYAYETNKIIFEKYMYGYFSTVSLYEPVIIAQLLADRTDPYGELEIFEADGVNKTFSYTITIPESAQIVCTEDGKIVKADINTTSHEITFPDVLPVGKQYGLEYYYSGSYNIDWNIITENTLSQKDIESKMVNILARLLVIAWAEEVRNMLVDVQNLMQDSDFKATPNSSILKAKTEWIKEMQYDNRRDQTKLAWQLRFSSDKAKFKRF